MKKKNQETTLFNNNKIKNINKDEDSIKSFHNEKTRTTNVNILLNRVRNDRRESLRKKIIFISSLVIVLSVMAVFLIL